MIEEIIVLLSTSVLLLGTPGPATLSLAGIGATFGFKNGLQFLLGILAGLGFVIIGSAIGLATLFTSFPGFRLFVQTIGALYIIYIAYKIATAPVLDTSKPSIKSMPKFKEGFILNLLNPKAYAAFLALFSQFLLPIDPPILAFSVTAIICFMIAVIIDTIWLSLGQLIRPLFQPQSATKIIQFVLALLMVVSVVWSFIHSL